MINWPKLISCKGNCYKDLVLHFQLPMTPLLSRTWRHLTRVQPCTFTIMILVKSETCKNLLLQYMHFFGFLFHKMTPECYESGTSHVSLMTGFIEDLNTLSGNSLGNHLMASLTILWQNSWSITGQRHKNLTSIC